MGFRFHKSLVSLKRGGTNLAVEVPISKEVGQNGGVSAFMSIPPEVFEEAKEAGCYAVEVPGFDETNSEELKFLAQRSVRTLEDLRRSKYPIRQAFYIGVLNLIDDLTHKVRVEQAAANQAVTPAGAEASA